MPSDGLGCTRATMIERESHGRHESDRLEDASKDVSKGWSISSSFSDQDGDKRLELFVSNEECLVSASQQLVLIGSLPLVHTARRCYRLNSKCEMGGLLTDERRGGGKSFNVYV